tara:strand:+ start:105 stop:311 length:207 start_codon:yes stop_codon:yes gene_type:complete
MEEQSTDPRESPDYIDENDDRLRVHITEDSFALKGRLPIEKKHIMILLAIIAAALGVSYEQVLETVGI